MFNAYNSSKDTPNCSAIDHNVSPDLTVYEPSASSSYVTSASKSYVNTSSGLIKSLLRLFACLSASTVVPTSLAIPQRVSPSFTITSSAFAVNDVPVNAVIVATENTVFFIVPISSCVLSNSFKFNI